MPARPTKQTREWERASRNNLFELPLLVDIIECLGGLHDRRLQVRRVAVQHVYLTPRRQLMRSSVSSCCFDRKTETYLINPQRLQTFRNDSLISPSVNEPLASDPITLILVSIVNPCLAASTSPSSCSDRPELTAGYRRAASILAISFLCR